MTGMPGCRLDGAVLGQRAPWGDVGHVRVCLYRHPYLLCYVCAVPLQVGPTSDGATVLICHTCHVIMDTRRMD